MDKKKGREDRQIRQEKRMRHGKKKTGVERSLVVNLFYSL